MNDTDPAIAAMIQARMMALTGEERFMMGIRMCEAARRMVLSSMPGGLSKSEQKQWLYQRYYGEPLPADFFSRAGQGNVSLSENLPLSNCASLPAAGA